MAVIRSTRNSTSLPLRPLQEQAALPGLRTRLASLASPADLARFVFTQHGAYAARGAVPSVGEVKPAAEAAGAALKDTY